jgi:chromosome partitioning protein
MLSSARSIVFHSYKGGTGKTTIAANVSAVLAKKGSRVLLLDLDVYAPSLHSYFDIEPNRWINDFLLESAELKDVIVDVTSQIPLGIIESGNKSNSNGDTRGVASDEGSPLNSSTSQPSPSYSRADKISGRNNHYDGGKLWVAFANPQKEEVYKLEGGKQERVQLIRRFIAFREELFSNFDVDYLIIDTSPGIRYWSLNALAAADLLYLTLKAGDLDVTGTKKMASDIYSTFSKYGAQSYLLLNRVAGYCIPHTQLLHHQHQTGSPSPSSLQLAEEQRREEDFESTAQTQNEEMLELSQQLEIDVIAALPCYCDIQFSKKEFLTALRQPDHPFAKKIADLAEQSQIRSGGLRK